MQSPPQSAQIGQQITQIILTSQEPQTLLARIAKAVGESFQVEACLIVAGTKPVATSQKALWCADHYPDHQYGNSAQLLEELALKDDGLDAQPLAIPDLQISDVKNAINWRSPMLPIRAVLGIHTPFQASVNGTIILGRSQPHAWTTGEKELLSAVSESVALAISQLQLTRQVLAATRYQTLLNQLSQATRNALNLDQILQMAIASTAQALQVSRGLILLLKDNDRAADSLPFPSGKTKPKGKQDANSSKAASLKLKPSQQTSIPSKSRPSKQLPKTEIMVACEWSEPTPEPSLQVAGTDSSLLNQSFWLSDSTLCQQALSEAPEPIVIADQRDSPNIDTSREPVSIFDQQMRPALLIVPLLGAPSNAALAAPILGFLVLQHDQPRSWYTDELELVKWVSAQVSASLIHHQTLWQVQSLVEDRTAQLQQSLEVQAKLYEKTRQQIDQLQQLNQLKEEFMSSMSHELRTPLTTMSLAIRMLRQPALPVERRDKYLEILEQQCNQEIDLINDLLSLQRLESNQAHIQPQKIDLMLLIRELAESFEQKWADKRLTLSIEGSVRSPSVGQTQSLMLNTDPDSLNRILLELLTNAGKYSDPDTTVHLQVTHQVQPSVNQVVLTLTNSGPGISPADLSHIFDKFRRGQGVTQKAVQGTGLGLALVKCLVEHLNGTIDVKSSPSENSQTSLTSFTLTLPQFQQQHPSLEH